MSESLLYSYIEFSANDTMKVNLKNTMLHAYDTYL